MASRLERADNENMVTPNFSDRHRFARRLGAFAGLIIVHAVLLGSGWVLAGEVGLLLAIAVALVVEAKLAKHRTTTLDRSSSSSAQRPDRSAVVSDPPLGVRCVRSTPRRGGSEVVATTRAAGRRRP